MAAGKSKANSVPLAIGLLIAAVIAVVIGMKMMPGDRSQNTTSAKSEALGELEQKAQDTQGDFSKLSAEDQVKFRTKYGSQIEMRFSQLYTNPPSKAK